MIAPELALALLLVTGLDGQTIAINPREIVSIRAPREGESLGHPDVRCIISMTDGHFISVIETCEVVRAKLEGGGP